MLRLKTPALLFIAATAAIAHAAPPVGLADYRVKGKPIVLEGVEEDASGIAVAEGTDHLFVVLNGNTTVLEVSPDGDIQRTIKLRGFNDTEDIVSLGNSRLAVVEERRRKLCMFDLATNASMVRYRDADVHVVDPQPAENRGLEGLAYDAANQRFFIVKEKEPRKIYQVTVKPDAPPAISAPWDAQSDALGMRDLSGVFYDANSGHLLLLSDESACIVECTLTGEEVARLSLRAGSAGLERTIPQAEGITLDADGRLYICSEPNLVYTFEKNK